MNLVQFLSKSEEIRRLHKWEKISIGKYFFNVNITKLEDVNDIYI